jgi:hypothetical protein
VYDSGTTIDGGTIEKPKSCFIRTASSLPIEDPAEWPLENKEIVGAAAVCHQLKSWLKQAQGV